MNTTGCAAVFVAAVALCAACGDAPKVVQGKVVSYDAASRSIVVRDECPPNAEITLDAARADLGADPQPQDLVRAAYRDAAGKAFALRVMNLTRQKELGFLAKAGSRRTCR